MFYLERLGFFLLLALSGLNEVTFLRALFFLLDFPDDFPRFFFTEGRPDDRLFRGMTLRKNSDGFSHPTSSSCWMKSNSPSSLDEII
jgi:hypothetical protein